MPQTKKLNPKLFCENFSDNADLRLRGSQMNLTARPRSSAGKASARALPLGGFHRTRRPMSAVPHSDFPGGPRNKRRPYSADSQFLASNRPARRYKNSSNFLRTQEDSFLDHSESEKDNYQISSSTPLNSLISDEPTTSGPWTDIHCMPLTSRPADLDANESLTNTSDLLCTFSDISEEPTNSEKSLGERICEMAQKSACDIDLTDSKTERNNPETEIPKSAEAELEEEDTRNLSNRELHFRMIAAGLITRPGSKIIQADFQQSEVDVIKEEDCNVPIDAESETSKTEEKGKDGNPEESGTESSKFVRRTVSFGEGKTDEGSGTGEGEKELNRPEVPVRFQQWVTTNNPSSPAKTEMTSLFCSTQLYPFRRRKSDLFLECMVEEILDEEQEKLLGVESPWAKPTGLAKNSEEKFGKDISISTWPTTTREPKDESANDGNKERVIPIEKDDGKHEENSFSLNPNGCEAWNSKYSVESSQSKIGVPSTTTVQINKSTVQPPCDMKKNSIESGSEAAGPSSKKAPGKYVRNSAPISGRRTSVISSTKVSSTVAVATCRFSRTAKSRFSPSRRNSKTNPSSDEERLPGECASEVESWMSVKCGDDVIKSRGTEVQTTKISAEGIQADSTFDEIFDLLKVLEEDEKSSSSLLPSSTNKSTGAGDSAVSVASDSLHEGQHYDQNAGAKKAHISSTDNDMKNILSYLDKVDESCDSALTSDRVSPLGTMRSRSYNRDINASENSERIDELLVMSHVDLAREVLSARLTLEESTKTIELLRASLKEQREAQTRREKNHKSAMDKKLHEVKSECEAILKRHQKFIDQLIADKAALSERCERLVNDSRQAEERHTKTIHEMEERHKIEIQRTKDIATATEKLRHERWVEKKTQKIKELTVRGLEPELNRMSTQHEQELSSLRTLHAQELEQAELRAARRCSQQLEALRHQMQQEQEEALTREREQHRQRLEKMQQVEDDKLEEQRRLLVAEIRRERDRLAAHEVALEAQLEERKRLLEKETERERERLRREYIEKAEVLQNANQIEMTRLRESLETEKEAWLAANKQQQAQAVAQATAELKEQLRRERDRELEAVIERLENEATQTRLEKEQAAENRIRRLRDQYNNELQEAERELSLHQAKNSELRAALQEKEAALVSLEVQNRSLHTELQETRKIAEHLSAERADIKKAVQKEIESDMEKLRAEIAEVRAKHVQETMMFSEQMERERNIHQQELQNLYTRVRQAIEKKDDIVQTAKAKHRAAEDHIKHLEAMLQHQRRINNHTALP